MIELDLLGVGGDGESLVFTDSNGERYRVQITDELRGVTRRDRPKLESAPAPSTQTLRPRDIQSLLRAGATPEDIARTHNIDIAAVIRYEAPVTAEKEYALQRARATQIGTSTDGPTMGDLVVDRLAARGVDPSSLTWSAQREPRGPWQICLSFVQGAVEHGAHWVFPSSGVLEAVDQEARWLTETVSQAPTASIFTPMPSPEPESTDTSDVRARESLIDQLNAARGKRQQIEYDLAEDEAAEFAEAIKDQPSDAPSISARIYSLAHTRTKDETPEEGPHSPDPSSMPTPDPSPRPSDSTPSGTEADDDSHSLNEPEALPGLNLPEDSSGEDAQPATPTKSTKSRRSGKKGKSRRRSVPSWDEIVFGSKPQ